MAEFEIKVAQRKQARLRLAFQGPSGSGKTATALLVAKGIVEGLVEAGELPHSMDPRIGVIDTERQSAELYSHMVPFATIQLGPPYTTARFAGALRTFEAAGYPVIIIDSLSHEWVGAGGILSLADQFGDWKDATPVHDEFVDAMLRSPAHLMVTMRSKTAWVIEQKENRQGRMVSSPTRIGMAPVQRPGIEYEFTTLLSLDTDMNKVTVLKDRTEMFGAINSVIPRLTAGDGQKLVKWLMAGAPLKPEDSIGSSPEQKVLAITEVGVTTIAAAPTVPDLARLFESLLKDLREFKGRVDGGTLGQCQARLVAAKDKRKADFGVVPKPAGPQVETISPDGMSLLEEMLAAGRVDVPTFLEEFIIRRVSELPLARWAEAVKLIIRMAAAAGHDMGAYAGIEHPVHVPAAAPPTLPELANQVASRIAERQQGGSLFTPAAADDAFADFPNDIPY